MSMLVSPIYRVTSGYINNRICSAHCLLVTLRASCGAVYCNRSCLFVCL